MMATMMETSTSGTPHRPAIEPLQPVTDPALWTGAELGATEDWIYRLDDAEIAELDGAIQGVKAKGIAIKDIRISDFPLPRLDDKLHSVRDQVIDGRGLALIKGVPVARYDRADAAIAFWGIGLRIGVPVSQNAKGHLLGHVKDLSGDGFADAANRGYHTSSELPWHADSCDVVVLLCLETAKAGGASTVVSAAAIHNEILARRPDLAAELAKPWYRDRRGEVPEGKEPWWRLPVFNYHGGALTTSWQGGYIRSAQRFPELPRFTPLQAEALDVMTALADELCHGMVLERGDIQLVHNHVVLHSRSGYEDDLPGGRKRHLMRLWLATPEGRPLPPGLTERYGADGPGGRPAGIFVKDMVLKTPLDAE